ncbi:hypothetical protein M0812_26093 [Anaeramoeba flamelloides]|uniref:Uncharacterized protein n=1 Tax=Anaeramoeba flamelloides TaxID=1746091 RepID=A0AAV7YF37_9EUKA|nr:hypothetical protein M0812_26093 [Anaeramoeba flamelloides]
MRKIKEISLEAENENGKEHFLKTNTNSFFSKSNLIGNQNTIHKSNEKGLKRYKSTTFSGNSKKLTNNGDSNHHDSHHNNLTRSTSQPLFPKSEKTVKKSSSSFIPSASSTLKKNSLLSNEERSKLSSQQISNIHPQSPPRVEFDRLMTPQLNPQQMNVKNDIKAPFTPPNHKTIHFSEYSSKFDETNEKNFLKDLKRNSSSLPFLKASPPLSPTSKSVLASTSNSSSFAESSSSLSSSSSSRQMFKRLPSNSQMDFDNRRDLIRNSDRSWLSERRRNAPQLSRSSSMGNYRMRNSSLPPPNPPNHNHRNNHNHNQKYNNHQKYNHHYNDYPLDNNRNYDPEREENYNHNQTENYHNQNRYRNRHNEERNYSFYSKNNHQKDKK